MKAILCLLALFTIVAQAQWTPILIAEFTTQPLLNSTRDWGLRRTMAELKANGTIPNVLFDLANTAWAFNYTESDAIYYRFNCTMRSRVNDTVNDLFIVKHNSTTQVNTLVSAVLMITTGNVTTNITTGTTDGLPAVNDSAAIPIDTTPVTPPVNDTPITPPVNDTPITPPVNDTPITPPVNDTPITPPVNDTPTGPSFPGGVVNGPVWIPTGIYTLAPPLHYRLPSVNGSIDFGVDFIVRNATALGLIPNGTYFRDPIFSVYRQIHVNWCYYNVSTGISNRDNSTHFTAQFYVNYSMPIERRVVLAYNYTVLPTAAA